MLREKIVIGATRVCTFRYTHKCTVRDWSPSRDGPAVPGVTGWMQGRQAALPGPVFCRLCSLCMIPR